MLNIEKYKDIVLDNLDECSIDLDLKYNIRCLDPVMKYCQGCKYGIINYSDDVENYYDTLGANFETNCIYGLEKQKPSKEEMAKFDNWCKNRKRV